jgi:hypothetical protein
VIEMGETLSFTVRQTMQLIQRNSDLLVLYQEMYMLAIDDWAEPSDKNAATLSHLYSQMVELIPGTSWFKDWLRNEFANEVCAAERLLDVIELIERQFEFDCSEKKWGILDLTDHQIGVVEKSYLREAVRLLLYSFQLLIFPERETATDRPNLVREIENLLRVAERKKWRARQCEDLRLVHDFLDHIGEVDLWIGAWLHIYGPDDQLTRVATVIKNIKTSSCFRPELI